MRLGRILVVEDNPVTRKLFRVTLATEGHEVREAADAKEALAIAQNERFDLVLADVLLPDMDGVELAAALRHLPGVGSAPIVAISGFLTKVEQARAGALGFDDAVLKPIEPARLVQIVQSFLLREKTGATAQKHVLIVDDDPIQLKMVSVAMAHAGFAVTPTSNAGTALEAARRRRPDVILSDVLMPETDGFWLCMSTTREPLLAQVPVVLMSAHYVDARDRAFATQLGASAYVTRSEGLDVLVDAVSSSVAVGRRSGGAATAEDQDRKYYRHVLSRQAEIISEQADRCIEQASAIRVLGSISDALSRNLDVDAALAEVLAHCLDAAGLAVGAIFLGDAPGAMTLRAEIGRHEPLGNPRRGESGDLRTFFGHPDLLERVRAGKKPLVIPGEGLAAAAAADVLASAGLTAALFLPIRSGDEGLGVMFMGSREAEVVRGDWRAFAQTVATQIGQALVLSQAFTRIAASERTRLLSERLSALGTLASGVAHEINNPLTYILANLHHLDDALGGADDCDPEKRRELVHVVDEARQGAERVRRIVRDLRVFARGEDDAAGPTDVKRALESALNLVSAEIRARARLTRAYTDAPMVDAPEARLVQVFVNLLVNAAQAIPEGRWEDNEIRVDLGRDDAGRVVVRIGDTGAGIPEELRERVFDPFFTTKPVGQGTGLGLSICHSIVRQSGGELTFESVVGKGTTFSIVLPASKDPLAAALRPPSAGPPSSAGPRKAPVPGLRRGRVLVVDDEPAIGRSIKRWLDAEHDVTILTSGRAALERLQSGEEYDVILSDLTMPEIGGKALHDEVARFAPQMAERMVFLTGGAYTKEAMEFLERVPNARFEKPFRVSDLRDAVRTRVK